MSNKLLKKMVSNSSSFTKEEMINPIKSAIAESDMYLSILNSLDKGHVILDRNGVVRFFNQTIFSLIPYSRFKRMDEGKSIEDVIVDKDMRDFVLDVIDGKEKPQPKDFTIGSMNEMRTIRFEFKRLLCEDEFFLDIVVSDISENIRKETRLRRSESLASMTTMAAGIAHDIKNPLAAMKIHLQLMEKSLQKKGSLSAEDANKYISVLEEEIEHLNSTAVDFLYAVKPMNAELRLDSINKIIEDLYTFLAPEANEKNISLVLDLDNFIPRLEIDAKYVRQAFLNLVQNAFSAMPEGGTLKIKSRLHGDFIEVIFSDTGTGIPEEMISKIFEPYYTTKASGTGLGLTTVYKIMKEHEGDIHVKSEIGKGTSFILQFPVPASQRFVIEDEKNEHDFDC